MRKAVHVTWPEDETPAKLKWIFAQLMLRMPGGLGACARPGIVLAQQVEQARVSQLQRLVGFAPCVHQQWKADSGPVAEGAGIGAIAKADRGQAGSSFSKCPFIRAQLRDVFAAENSTVVPQEDDHRRLLEP
jgi:hypothetical protein